MNVQGLHRVLNMPYKYLNMPETYLNKQSSEYARILNVSDAVHSTQYTVHDAVTVQITEQLSQQMHIETLSNI